MSGRYREFDEEAALAQAAEVFWIKGYESASTEDLLTAMQINKGSMYHAFGNKRTLFIKVFEWFSARFIRNIKDAFVTNVDPRDAIRAIFYGVANPPDPSAHAKGCFYVNILGEMTGLDADLAEIARQKLLDVEEVFHRELLKARRNGMMPADINASLLAKYLVNFWNGLNISRRMYNEKELKHLVDMNLRFLDEA
ncbi:MAG TPA: TetR/AcrR family transcriptional regulator [Chitinophaga sp.]|uniref:TetR/AcrR family transcriptional regulator n=1 Tax=Chitinophaga sp. TaxID=1869181 RepID=UPI002B559F0F|nr:TetR/AcrR family transcriptional regulator [Chitinophaga sp.]HVI44369.1 TetR/AcrR family transcriptional regulator [Chitinophaga sp.]